jgi:hypothetical protein
MDGRGTEYKYKPKLNGEVVGSILQRDGFPGGQGKYPRGSEVGGSCGKTSSRCDKATIGGAKYLY